MASLTRPGNRLFTHFDKLMTCYMDVARLPDAGMEASAQRVGEDRYIYVLCRWKKHGGCDHQLLDRFVAFSPSLRWLISGLVAVRNRRASGKNPPRIDGPCLCLTWLVAGLFSFWFPWCVSVSVCQCVGCKKEGGWLLGCLVAWLLGWKRQA